MLGGGILLQPIWIEDLKLKCPRCKNEVLDHTIDEKRQSEFVCIHCKSKVRFAKEKNKYIAWIIDEF